MSDVLSREGYESWVGKQWQGNMGLNPTAVAALKAHDAALREELEAAKTMFKEVWKALGESDKDLEQSQARITALERALGDIKDDTSQWACGKAWAECRHEECLTWSIAIEALAGVQEVSDAEPTG